MRKWMIGIVVLLVAGFMAVPMLLPSALPTAAQSGETVMVEQRTVYTTVESTGTVMPNQSLSLSFGANGTIAEINAVVGDMVEVGQVLARLNTVDLEYQLELERQQVAQAQANYDNLIAPPTAQELAQASASLASAQSQLASTLLSEETAADTITTSCVNLETNLETLQDTQEAYNDYVTAGYTDDANFIPDPNSEAGARVTTAQNSYDVAQAQCNTATMNADKSAQITSAEAAVAQAQAAYDALIAGPTTEQIDAQAALLAQAQLQLEHAERALADAEIVAPFAGVITNLPIIVGQSVTTQTNAVTLMDTSTLYIEVAVDELDIAQIQLGQSSTITIDALVDAELEGEVTRIAPAGSVEQGVVTYAVRVSLTPNAEYTVLIGMTADVAIIISATEDALLVPTDAVQRDGDQEYLLVVGANGTSERIDIVSGQITNGMTVITGDVQQGQEIYLRPPQQTQGGGFFPQPPAGAGPGAGG
jgi:HlyD family secretion protein